MIQIAVDDDVLRHRLMTRTNNPYGKGPGELELILAANADWAASYERCGAILVNGTQPIDDVVADVISAAERGVAALRSDRNQP